MSNKNKNSITDIKVIEKTEKQVENTENTEKQNSIIKVVEYLTNSIYIFLCKYFNTENFNIQKFSKNELSLTTKIEILKNFITSHITDIVYSIKLFTDNLHVFTLLNTDNENELKKELLKIKSIKVTNFEKTELIKRRNEYILKNFKDSVKFNNETNLFEININNYINNFEKTKNKFVLNCVNYNNKNLFSCYIDDDKNTEKMNNSTKFNNLFKFEKYSYNLIRNIKLFENLRKIFVLSVENENEKLQLMKFSSFFLSEKIFETKVSCNNEKQRTNLTEIYISELDKNTNETIKENFELDIFTSIEKQTNKILKFSNVVSLMKQINETNKK